MFQKRCKLVRSKKTRIYVVFSSFLITIGLAYFVQTFFFESYYIPSSSMESTLLPGDYIFVSKLQYGPAIFRGKSKEYKRLKGIGTVERNDIIVFNHPTSDQSQKTNCLIKRCVGLPGDNIQFITDEIYINGLLAKSPSDYMSFSYPQQVLSLKKDDMEKVVGKIGYKTLGKTSTAKYWNLALSNSIRIPQKGDRIKLDTSNVRLFWNGIAGVENVAISPNNTKIFKLTIVNTNLFFFIMVII